LPDKSANERKYTQIFSIDAGSDQAQRMNLASIHPVNQFSEYKEAGFLEPDNIRPLSMTL